MKIGSNTYSPNFGMSLKIDKNARPALKKLSRETLREMQKSGEDLKNTQFYDVKINNDLSAEITANGNAYFGEFITKDYVGKHDYGKPEGCESAILISKYEKDGFLPLASVLKYDWKLLDFRSHFKVFGPLGSCNNISHLKTLTQYAKLLDGVAVEKANKSTEKQKFSKVMDNILKKTKNSMVVDNLLEDFGV